MIVVFFPSQTGGGLAVGTVLLIGKPLKQDTNIRVSLNAVITFL